MRLTEENVRKLQKHFSETLLQAIILGAPDVTTAPLILGVEITQWLLGESCPNFEKLIGEWDKCEKETQDEKLEKLPNATNLPN